MKAFDNIFTTHQVFKVYLVLLGIFCTSLLLTVPLFAATAQTTINVTTFDDELNLDGDCSLREAIQAANTGADVDGCIAGGSTDYVINLEAGTYTLAIAGGGEVHNQTGDLNIKSNITIQGAVDADTIIDGNSIDRIFYIHGNTVELNRLTIEGGSISSGSQDGGGIYVYRGTLVVRDSMIQQNYANDEGGGIAVYISSLTIENSVVANNQADEGGGISSRGISNLSIVDSTVRDNVASDTGGGIFSVRTSLQPITLTIDSSLIANNQSEHGGSGIHNSVSANSVAVAVISNSTVSGNVSVTSGGGGIVNESSTGATAIFNINHTTLYGNTSGNNSSSIVNDTSHSATINIKNSIATGACTGPLNSYGYNLFQAGGCTLTEVENSGTDINGDPLLNPLVDNGGPTHTHLPQAGSLAVDAGNCTDIDGNSVTSDQRGQSRPSGATCDIGAVEIVTSEPSLAIADAEVDVDGNSILAIPVQLATDGLSISSAGFSLGYDSSCLNFSEVDDLPGGDTQQGLPDGDGLYDAVQGVPAGFVAEARHSAGTLELLIYPAGTVQTFNGDLVLMTLEFSIDPSCVTTDGTPVAAGFNFSTNPAPDFGNEQGEEVEGSAADGTYTLNFNAWPTNVSLDNSTVNENESSGTAIGALSTEDVDNPDDTHTYTLVDGNVSAFAIDGATLETNISFDYEDKDSYTTTIRTTDSGGAIFDKEFTITINDANDAPTDITLSNDNIDENLPVGTAVGLLSSEDEDGNDSHTYEIVSTVSVSFTIDGDELKSDGPLNFEDQASYTITIRTTDSGGATLEKDVTITVNDVNDAPTDITLSSDSIDENLPSGTAIGTLGSEDEDGNDSHTYEIVSSVPLSFAIDGGELKSDGSFNFEDQASHTITIRTTDSSGGTFENDVTITINDVNDAPTDITLSSDNIDENLPTGTVVGSLGTEDEDGSDSHTYEIISSAAVPFTIVGELLLSDGSFNYEEQASHTITIRTTDSGSATFEKDVTITVNDVNDTPTDITLSDDSINENLPTGTVIGTLSTEDEDGNDNHTYEIISSTPVSFTIVGNELKSDAEFNFENQASYTITIRTNDGGSETFDKEVTITINDVNEAPVAFDDLGWPDSGIPYIAVGGTGLDISVLSNDIDEDEDTLKVDSVGNGSEGNVTHTDGYVTYTPVENYNGTDTFTYIVTDDDPDNPLTDQGTVEVTVVENDPRGDCNSTGAVSSADLVAVILEVFDDDASNGDWWKIYMDGFAGSPIGCDANNNYIVSFGDLACTVLILFGEEAQCTQEDAFIRGESDKSAQLAIENSVSSGLANTVEIPITLNTNDNQIAAISFALNFDQAEFNFDATDSNNDGIPDAVDLHVDSKMVSYVNYNHKASRIEVALYNMSIPASLMEDGTVATIELKVNDPNTTGASTLSLSHSSAGSAEGRDIAVAISDNTASLNDAIRFDLFLPLITK